MDKNDYKKIVNDLYLFYRVFVGSKFTENLPAPHIKSLSKELMKMTHKEFKRLCVALPPRHSKSSLITLAYPMWRIFQNPNLNILIVNNSSSLSEKFGIQLREYIREFGKLFNVYLSDVKKSQSYLMFSDKDGNLYNGSVRLIGKGGAITGTDADILIIDDPYKGLDEEFTPSALQKTIDWFNNVVEQRIEPQTELIILHTRWHSDDLQGYIKKTSPDDYHFLEYPAILDDGTPLWKERYTIQELESKKKKMGNRMFSSLYQQIPLDDSGDFFDLKHIKYGKPLGEPIMSGRGWDIAGSEKVGDVRDYSVGVKMDLYPNDEVVITDIIRGQYGSSLKTVIQETADRDTPNCHIVIETGVGGAGKLLYKEWENQLKGFLVEQAIPITSKEDRATPFRNAIIDGKVYLDLDNNAKKTFIEELNGFPYSAHDDQVDSASHIYNYLCRQDKGNKPDLLFIDL